MRKHTISLIITAIILIFQSSCGLEVDEKVSYISLHPIDETRMNVGHGKYPDSTCVWEVKNPKTGNVLYLAGTSHVINELDLPLPSTYYAAYNQSDVLVTEIDVDNLGFLDKLKMIRWTLKNEEMLMNGDGTIEQQLKPDTIVMLKERFKDDYEKEINATPFMFMFGLSYAGEQKYGGVESMFEELAKRDGKPLKDLDEFDLTGATGDDFEKIIKTHQAQVRKEGLDGMVKKQLSQPAKPYIDQSTRRGNRVQMKKKDLKKKQILAELYKPLLTNRNMKWLPKMKKMLEPGSQPIEFVLYH